MHPSILTTKILQKLWLPSTVTCCTMGVVEAKGAQECDPSKKLVRAKDLPLYPDQKDCPTCVNNEGPKPSLLYDTVRCSRQEFWFLMDQFKIAKGELYNCLNDALKQTEEKLDILRKEENLLPRAGVIAAGGMTGFIAGLRHGMFRKLLYTTGGAGAMAALCYPKEATKYSEEGFKQFKKYLVITYHFLNGDETDIEKLSKYLETSPLLPPKSQSKQEANRLPKGKQPEKSLEGQKGPNQSKDIDIKSKTTKPPSDKKSASQEPPNPCDKTVKKTSGHPISLKKEGPKPLAMPLVKQKEDSKTCRCLEHSKMCPPHK